MRRVNLLPPEDRGWRAATQATTRTGVIGLLLILGALLVMVMIGLYLFYFIRIGNEEEQIAQLDQDTARHQARLEELAPYEDLQARLNAKKPIADGIFRTRFPWDEFLRGLAFVIPETTALDTLVARASPINITAPPGAAPEVQNLEPPGTVTFTGLALPDYRNISDFIVRMNSLRFLSNTALTAAELDREQFSSDAITFEADAGLVTRVGEFGDEVVLTGAEEESEEEGVEEDVDDQAKLADPQGEKASRPKVTR